MHLEENIEEYTPPPHIQLRVILEHHNAVVVVAPRIRSFGVGGVGLDLQTFIHINKINNIYLFQINYDKNLHMSGNKTYICQGKKSYICQGTKIVKNL